MNEQDPNTFAALGSYVWALDRSNMLLGNPATAQCFQMKATYNSVLPADLEPAVGSTSSPLQITVNNYSAVSVTLGTIVASGGYDIVPLGVNACGSGTVLNANGTCTFGVTFSPMISGVIPGAATLSHNAPNGPQVVALTGTGQ